MKSLFPALSASLLTASVLAAAPAKPFSNEFSVGFLQSPPYIREVTTTLVLPQLNYNHKGFLKLYPELYTNETASLTGTALTLLDDRSPCPNNLQDWCVGARLVINNTQNSGDYFPAPAGSNLTIKIAYDNATQKHDHTVQVDGKIVSSIPVTSDLNLALGRAIGFRTAIECQLELCGTVASHRYVNTKIVLDYADPQFGESKFTNGTTGELKTSDGGATWTVDEIVVMSFTYDE